MKWCARCVLPDTRPNLTLGEGDVCNACRSHEGRPEIDWSLRAAAFESVVENARQRSSGYDCLIPVSGGKDSTWQVVTCLEKGLNPLAVTWRTPGRTAIGQANLDNLIALGVDHIDYQVSPLVERKFVYRALVEKGDPGIPMHMALFSIPLAIAVRFEIPLVVWGENSAFEYGGTEEESTGFRLDQAWLSHYGVTHGTTAGDWVSDDLTAREMTPYFGPTDQDLESAGVLAVFLGYYFPWDVATSLRVARAHGFRVREEGPRTGYYDFADIDDDFISVHHWFKWYKFGFSRLFDNLSLEIRNERMTRQEALDIIRAAGDQTPVADIECLCNFLAISTSHFHEIAERFRNPEVWTLDGATWKVADFLIPDWRWA